MYMYYMHSAYITCTSELLFGYAYNTNIRIILVTYLQQY